MSTTTSSDSDDQFLLDNPFLKLEQKKCGIHPINKNRKKFGEYHNLFQELKQYEDRFFQYMRMSLDTFKYILEMVEHRLTKN